MIPYPIISFNKAAMPTQNSGPSELANQYCDPHKKIALCSGSKPNPRPQCYNGESPSGCKHDASPATSTAQPNALPGSTSLESKQF